MIDPHTSLTPDEAAALLGLSRSRIRQLHQQLGGVYRGGTYWYPRAAVEAYKARPKAKRGWPKGKPRKPKPAADTPPPADPA